MSIKRINVERTICETIVEDALARQYTISVGDGEECVVKRSTDREIILNAMRPPTGDYLFFRDRFGAPLGFLSLIYNTGEAVIGGHTESSEMEDLLHNARWVAYDYQRICLKRAEQANTKLKEELLRVLAHLVGATDLLDRGGIVAAPSDKIFHMLRADCHKAIDDARTFVANLEAQL